MDASQLFQAVGIPVACMIVMGLGIWRAGKWSAKNVIEPLVSRHMQFLDKLEKIMESQANTLKIQAETLVKLAEAECKGVQE